MVGKETDFIVPLWSVSAARKILDKWEQITSTYLKKIEYSEADWLILTIFTVSVWGDAHKVNTVTQLIADELKKC